MDLKGISCLSITVGELRSTLCMKTPLYVRSGSYIKQMLLEHLSYIKQMLLEHLSYIIHKVERSSPTVSMVIGEA